ncbi:stalk domain-containing protein [Paenibacillus sp. MBLB4367]|uniref:stalk domain-containing protein n=1 Tax=Paenibacillus sp. MBLB4367 TaxID=3384767 RepID=UPI00390824AE
MFRIIRNNKDQTSSSLTVVNEGGILAETQDIGLFKIGKKEIGIAVEGEPLRFERKPLIREGHLLVPFRPLFEKLGLQVEWNDQERSVTGRKEGTEIRLSVDSTLAVINDMEISLPAEPQIFEDSLYVPLRFVGEAMQLEVEWDGVNREVRVGRPEQLAKQAVLRFLMHLEQGDDYKATHDLSESGLSIVERSPALAPYFMRKQWKNDVTSIQAEAYGTSTYMVKTKQRNRSYDFAEIFDQVQENWYQVVRTDEGQWKLKDSDLFQMTSIFGNAAGGKP